MKITNTNNKYNVLKECIGGIIYEFEELELYEKTQYVITDSEYYNILRGNKLIESQEVEALCEYIDDLQQTYQEMYSNLEF